MIIGFKRVAVIDRYTCKTCRESNGSILADVDELVHNCEYQSNDPDYVISGMRCRCVAIPIEDDKCQS